MRIADDVAELTDGRLAHRVAPANRRTYRATDELL
jgi:hypothetical protein